MAYASPSTINASQGLGAVLNYANEVSGNWLSNMFLLGIWVIILMGYMKAQNDFKGGLAVAGYSTFVVALLFWIGGFVSGWAFSISIAFAIIGTAVLLLDHE